MGSRDSWTAQATTLETQASVSPTCRQGILLGIPAGCFRPRRDDLHRTIHHMQSASRDNQFSGRWAGSRLQQLSVGWQAVDGRVQAAHLPRCKCHRQNNVCWQGTAGSSSNGPPKVPCRARCSPLCWTGVASLQRKQTRSSQSRMTSGEQETLDKRVG